MQQLGETRQEMTRGLMKRIEKIINSHQDFADKYYIWVHAKPDRKDRTIIREKIMITKVKPKMMLSTMLFGVDNREGKLTLEWALAGDWPTMDTGSVGEPVPEVIESFNELQRNSPTEIFY